MKTLTRRINKKITQKYFCLLEVITLNAINLKAIESLHGS